MHERILVIGSAGQIGSELVPELRKTFGDSNVFAADIKEPPQDVKEGGPFQLLNVMDAKQLIHFVIRNKITQIYHLAAVLSGNAEKLPMQAWEINMESLMNVLETARLVEDINKVFWPSSIAVFGKTTPRELTPQRTVMEPLTVYGISKLAGERWCEYYFNKYGVDVRSIRYPGIISHKTEPGGGTTDYAIEIYIEALKQKKYNCFLKEDTVLPMMYMDDAISATINLMEFPKSEISVHAGYNLAGFSTSPVEVANEIRIYMPGFTISHSPDFRQEIADSWPASIDDSIFRYNNTWKPKFDLKSTTDLMLKELGKKLNS
jgi:nucleoside-diphosphate-sugar epimerase